MPKLSPRGWQVGALEKWEQASHRGIVAVVTGGGKTIFALSCIDRLKPQATLIVVPTAALLDQWWEEAASYFDLPLADINVITGRGNLRLGAINIAVLNTASTLPDRKTVHPCFLIVDECHKAASDQFRSVLQMPTYASLGLSATPERPYDDGLKEVLIPALGEVIYSYNYAEALRDNVIVPFDLFNVVFDLEEGCQVQYDKVTKAIAKCIDKYGVDADETVAQFLRRARIMNLSSNRVELALKLVAANKGRRMIVFHEDIEACNVINQVLVAHNLSCGVYHSQMPLKARVETLRRYRAGEIGILVTCRALDEGFNVPETEVGIIAASTATRRQRIQRLGRVVRPAKGKERATIYTLVATKPEINRLKAEEQDLQGVANVVWSRA